MTQSHATDYTSAANYEASVNRDEEARKRILAREATFPLRSATDRLMKILAFGAMVFGLFWLVWILVTLVQNGVGAMSLTLFTAETPPPGAAGGLKNAIVGSVLMATFGTLIGTPIGILAGIYLSEYGKGGWLAPATRFLNERAAVCPVHRPWPRGVRRGCGPVRSLFRLGRRDRALPHRDPGGDPYDG